MEQSATHKGRDMNIDDICSVRKFAEIEFNATTVRMATEESNQSLLLMKLRKTKSRTKLWHEAKLYMTYDEFSKALDKLVLRKIVVQKVSGDRMSYRVHLARFRRAVHKDAFKQKRKEKQHG